MPNSLQLAMDILVDDSAFEKAAHTCQHIVTHYLYTKMELWMGICMYPNHVVTNGLLTNKISPGRCAIHFHFVLFVER